ncbi:hypothetical protein PRZ48_009197 [Zasmidium cellare]|uniref:Uncharacterized protein n=1 Tax=Zasmidium cellare TaxID=395010 RepID=A0ABR0EB40_ZASCE|nr:hypothetical protein PRZ48_009197 [Zasmidium cellare]
MPSLRSESDEDEDQNARSCSEMVKEVDADIGPSVSLQQPVIYWSNGRRKAKLTLDVTYALPSETIDADIGGIAESLMEPILRHLRQQYSGQGENVYTHAPIARRESMEAPSKRRDRSGPDPETKSSTPRRRKLGSENVDAPSPVDQLAKFIAETIIKGGHVLQSDDGNVQGWLRDLQKLDPGSMTLDQLFRTHTRIADGASRLSRQSSFIRCLLMVIISKRTGRPTSSERSRANAEEQAKDARLRRYLASTGRLFIELINAVSLTHGQRAYNICVALFVSPVSNFSFNMPDLRRLQGGYSKEIVDKSAFDPAKAVTAADLRYGQYLIF